MKKSNKKMKSSKVYLTADREVIRDLIKKSKNQSIKLEKSNADFNHSFDKLNKRLISLKDKLDKNKSCVSKKNNRLSNIIVNALNDTEILSNEEIQEYAVIYNSLIDSIYIFTELINSPKVDNHTKHIYREERGERITLKNACDNLLKNLGLSKLIKDIKYEEKQPGPETEPESQAIGQTGEAGGAEPKKDKKDESSKFELLSDDEIRYNGKVYPLSKKQAILIKYLDNMKEPKQDRTIHQETDIKSRFDHLFTTKTRKNYKETKELWKTLIYRDSQNHCLRLDK